MEQLHTAERLTPNQLLEGITKAYMEKRVTMIPYPHMLYAFFKASNEYLGTGEYTSYSSSSITSGAMALPNRSGEKLPFGEALALNTDYALQLMQAVINDNPTIVDSYTNVNPVTLGKIPMWHYIWRGEVKVNDGSWNDGDYLRFWFATIAGVDVPEIDGESRTEHWMRLAHAMEAFVEAHKELTADVSPIMNDRKLSHQERSGAYFEFTNRFVSVLNYLVADGQLTASPVEELIGLIDFERSLGCRSEFQLAQLLGIPATQVARTAEDWHDTPLKDMAQNLEDHDARFSTPSGRIVLALAPRLHDLRGVSLDLHPEIAENIRQKKQLIEKERLRFFDRSMEKVVSGPINEARATLIGAMAQLAYRIDRGREYYFDPAYIDEVFATNNRIQLNPGLTPLDYVVGGSNARLQGEIRSMRTREWHNYEIDASQEAEMTA